MQKNNPAALYTPTNSLCVTYKSPTKVKNEAVTVKLDGEDIHLALRKNTENYLALRKSVSKNDNALKSCNFAGVQLTLLYNSHIDEGAVGDDMEYFEYGISPTNEHLPIFSAQDIFDKKKKTIQPDVAASKQLRNSDFNAFLKNHATIFDNLVNEKIYSYARADKAITEAQFVASQIASHMFHENYHHTEQTVMFLASQEAFLQKLVNKVIKKEGNDLLIYGVVMDMYTERLMCTNCNIGLACMQHSQEQGLLANLKNICMSKNILMPDSVYDGGQLSLSVRVSGNKSCNGASKKGEPFNLADDESHLYSLNKDHYIFQSHKTLPPKHKLGQDVDVSTLDKEDVHFSLITSSFFKSKVRWNNAVEKTLEIEPDKLTPV